MTEPTQAPDRVEWPPAPGTEEYEKKYPDDPTAQPGPTAQLPSAQDPSAGQSDQPPASAEGTATAQPSQQ